MDTLFLLQHIETNNWDAFEARLTAFGAEPSEALSLAETALRCDRPHMLEELLRYAMDTSEIVFDPALRAYMDRKISLAVKAMRFDKHECFGVVFACLDDNGRYECLRDSMLGNRENFLKIITRKIDPQQCWRMLEYATKLPNSNILDHLLDISPVPFEREDIEKLDHYAPYICDTVTDVVNLGWNNCLERILNLTPMDFDATEICVMACEKENWEGARIALKFTSEAKVRAFNNSFDPDLTKRTVGYFLSVIENERLNAALAPALPHKENSRVRRKI